MRRAADDVRMAPHPPPEGVAGGGSLGRRPISARLARGLTGVKPKGRFVTGSSGASALVGTASAPVAVGGLCFFVVASFDPVLSCMSVLLVCRARVCNTVVDFPHSIWLWCGHPRTPHSLRHNLLE